MAVEFSCPLGMEWEWGRLEILKLPYDLKGEICGQRHLTGPLDREFNMKIYSK